MNDTDDFWGDVPDWDDRPGRSDRRSDARRPSAVDGLGATVRRWWDRALSGDSDATRTHGIPRPDRNGVTDDARDDRSAHRDPTPHRQAARRRSEHPTHETVAHHDLDAAFATGDAEVRRDGIDPLILRVGAVVVTLTLLLPFVIGGDDPTDTITGAPVSDVADVSTVTLSPSSAPAPDTGGAPPASGTLLDPATLPPAIPVNEVGGDTTDTIPDTTPAEETAPSTTDGDEPVGTDVPDDGDPGDGDEGDGDSGDTGETGDADETTGDGTGASTGAVTGSATADEGASREARDCAIEYEVVAGDFWLRLAEEAGVPLADLLDANAATTSTPLFPGSTICLPAGSRTPNPPDDVTTTTATPTTTTTTVPVRDVPETADEIQQLIRDIWPDDLEERAIEIAFRESRFDPRAKNFCCYGIFQIYWSVHRSWLADLGVTSDEQLYDPETNITAALVLYERAGGWGPWGF
ncbi:MAG: LysM peptidoglycan-binding domain-containing protein [Actinomycetota bacterium]